MIVHTKEKLINHLKHLLFIDATSNHKMGYKHNAEDRSVVYDKFMNEIDSKNFDNIYDRTCTYYFNLRHSFEEGYFSSLEEIDEYIKSINLENNIKLLLKNKLRELVITRK